METCNLQRKLWAHGKFLKESRQKHTVKETPGEKESLKSEGHELGSSLPPSPDHTYHHMHLCIKAQAMFSDPSWLQPLGQSSLLHPQRLQQTLISPLSDSVLISSLASFFFSLLLLHVCLIHTTRIKIIWGQNLHYIIFLRIVECQAQTSNETSPIQYGFSDRYSVLPIYLT